MRILRLVLLAAACAQPALACDLCSIYAATEARGEIGKGFFAGAAEQFTHFGTLQEDGEKVRDEADQFFDSAITQVFVGYNFTERLGLQFNAPLIHRWFRRAEPEGIESGSETGLGDVSVTAHFQAYRHERKHSTFTLSLLAGIKFPSGSTSRLKEELNEMDEGEGAVESGVHGHDLTLGSGSYDGILGSSLFARWKRAFFTGSIQYMIRSRGDFGYEFANDLIWSGGPGALLLLSDEYTLSLQANVSGEHKGLDKFRGQKAEDTGITAVYLGPELVFTWRDKISAELGMDFPMSLDNTALQIVPDYRLRAALTWHF
jgi:hypothetical protein